ncbi:hypothetical protein CIPAW_12G018200 [Carya illinoinensis]|uniref:Uncharacterized protein n=1 Tax=Carya illinoinensis TaxID=32201 RepID=A0A8T1NN07_CARIL|nr:hypothetical protein CIPAW_12G018200 [Carya illinoinensis]
MWGFLAPPRNRALLSIYTNGGILPNQSWHPQYLKDSYAEYSISFRKNNNFHKTSHKPYKKYSRLKTMEGLKEIGLFQSNGYLMISGIFLQALKMVEGVFDLGREH